MALLTGVFLLELGAVLLALLGLLYLLATKNFRHWEKKGVPFIKPTAFFGNFKDIALAKSYMGIHMANLYKQGEGKPFIGVFAFHRPVLLVRDPELVKTVLVKDFNYFMDRSFSLNEDVDPLFSKNLFGMNGPRWRHLRAKISPTFTSGKMKLMFQLVDACGSELTDCVRQHIENRDSVVEIKEIVARYNTDVIATCAFGIECNSMKNPQAEFRSMLRHAVELDFIRNLKSAIGFFAPNILSALKIKVMPKEVEDFVRGVVGETVQERQRTGIVRNDFLDLLIQLRNVARKEIEAPGPRNAETYPLEDDDFVAQAFVFLLAGFETSSNTMAFALYELARRPDLQARLRAEIGAGLRPAGGRLTYDALQAMPFLHAVVTETLRMYPILPFLDRVAMQDYRIPGTDVVLDKGTAIMLPILGMQRDPKYFDDPDAFNPERFSDENKQSVPPFVNIPFGEGPRICIGMRMGLMQVKVGLVHLLSRYEVQPCKETPATMEFSTKAITMNCKDGVPLLFTRVQDARIDATA